MLRKLKNNILCMGLIDGGIYLANRLLLLFGQWASMRKYYIMVQPIKTEELFPLQKPKFLISQLMQEDISEIYWQLLDKEETDKRFEQGAECLVACLNEQPVAYMWFISRAYYEEEDRSLFMIEDGLVWDFDFYVNPKYRLSSLFVELWNYANDMLRQRGVIYTISRVAASNYRSLNSHARLGAKPIAWCLYFSLFSLQLSISNMSPYLYLAITSTLLPKFQFGEKTIKKLFAQNRSAKG